MACFWFVVCGVVVYLAGVVSLFSFVRILLLKSLSLYNVHALLHQ